MTGTANMNIEDICALAPVVPVITVERIEDAVPLARALVAGGLRALEVTLRTPVALDAIRAMGEAVPDAVMGAGTLMSADDVARAKDAGCVFGVSPGATDTILDAADRHGLPMLPGVATPAEAMRVAERGMRTLKFFPAEANGGAAVLKAWGPPLAGFRFCPTGGVSLANAPDYLGLSNVVCVGGSWVAPADAVRDGDWDRIETLAREASTLAR